MGARKGYLTVTAQFAGQQLNRKAADQQHLSTLLPSKVGGTSLLVSNGSKSNRLLYTTNSETHDNLREDTGA